MTLKCGLYPDPSPLKKKKNVRERGVICTSGDAKLDRGDPHESPWTMLGTEGGWVVVEKGGLVSVYLSAILIWVITLQIEHSRSALLAEEHNEVCRRSIKQCESRGIYLKKSKALAGMVIISPRLVESDKGAGPRRKGCPAPGLPQLDGYPSCWHPLLTDFHLQMGGKKPPNISASIWSLSDTVHVVEQLNG